LDAKVLKTLEFHKIIEKLSGHAVTAMGKAMAGSLLPEKDFGRVNLLLQDTDEAAAVLRLKGAPPFEGIRDIRPSLRRASIGGTLGAEELVTIAGTSAGGRRVKRFLHAVHERHPLPRLHRLFGRIAETAELEEAIQTCIDENGEVLDRASPELARIRRERRTSEARVKERLEQLIRTPAIQKMLQDNLVTMRGDRYVIPVKQEYRSQFGGIVHDQSASGATLFIEPESVVGLNNRIRELMLAEWKEIEKILARLTALAAGHAEPLGENVELIAELDYIFAKAGLAHAMKAVKPEMNDRGLVRIRSGRHPLLSGEAVPLDLELGDAYTAVVITGPNTGGKTVALKTVGLLTLMAMSGLFVPAAEGTRLCVFDGVYADIGDEQSIEQNLSTFSSHMTNIISILNRMTPGSLVLLDELGAGTDPAEGSALAIAILDHVHRRGCRIVATTHYSELKAFAYERDGMINASMEFDVRTLRPTYRLLVGVPGRSNAFAIAERLGLDPSIIETASRHLGEDNKRVESMIASLEENRLTAEAERLKAERLRRELEDLRRSLEEERRRFEGQKEALMAKARREAQEAVAKARREAEEVIAELRRMAAEGAESIKEHRLIEAKKRLEDAVPDAAAEDAGRSGTFARGGKMKLSPGDEVHVVSLGRKGTVIDLGEAEATVQLGILKMKLPLSDLRPAKDTAAAGGAARAATAGMGVKRTRDLKVRTELDLRGATLDEALVEVDRFLDEAIMANLGQVSIIHGKGTGALRSGIQDYLRRHSLIKQFRLGTYGEGGSGVTVVELK